MKRIILATLLAIGISCPAFATSIDDQKAQVKQDYTTQKDNANHDYDKQVADLKAQYQNNPDKMNDELKILSTEHDKNIDDLNKNEEIKLQKINLEKNS